MLLRTCANLRTYADGVACMARRERTLEPKVATLLHIPCESGTPVQKGVSSMLALDSVETDIDAEMQVARIMVVSMTIFFVKYCTGSYSQKQTPLSSWMF